MLRHRCLIAGDFAAPQGGKRALGWRPVVGAVLLKMLMPGTAAAPSTPPAAAAVSALVGRMPTAAAPAQNALDPAYAAVYTVV